MIVIVFVLMKLRLKKFKGLYMSRLVEGLRRARMSFRTSLLMIQKTKLFWTRSIYFLKQWKNKVFLNLKIKKNMRQVFQMCSTYRN